MCCFYSDRAASLVVGGMRLLARANNEIPFACLSRALMQQDIEVKAAVMQFVNSMVMGVADVNAHALLRSDLNSVLIGETFDQAMDQVNSEMEVLKEIEREASEIGETSSSLWGSSPSGKAKASGPPPVIPPKPARGALQRLSVSLRGPSLTSGSGGTAASPPFPLQKSSSLKIGNESISESPQPTDKVAMLRRTSILRSKSIKTLHGPRAISEQKMESMLRNPTALAGISERDSIVEHDTDIEIQTKSNGRTEIVRVNPLMGSMAGSLVASKNIDKMESKLVDLFGGKKTKHRWYQVDATDFKWCAGNEKEGEFKGFVPVSTITDIRSYTTDQTLLATNPNSFEFETQERIFALGCDTAAEKDNWVTALQISRDASIMTKGSYKLQSKELTHKDLIKFAAMFKKQGAVYQSISIEDKRANIARNGLNLTDAKAVGEFARYETLAAGHSDMLLGIMQELLLIPQSSRGTWEAVYAGTKVRSNECVLFSAVSLSILHLHSLILFLICNLTCPL